MAYAHYDRLTALDATFLGIESDAVHMHVGAIGIFDAKPLTLPEGGLDMPRIRRLAGPTLARSRRFRQRLDRVPIFGDPVWVDDARFNLDYHLRHTALPAPGDERQLKRLAGRLLSQKLDRHKPLWEMWFVENLEGDRFAVITGPDSDAPPWLPRPAPNQTQLLAAETLRRAALPLDLLRAGGRALSEPRQSLDAARETLEGVSRFLGAGLEGGDPTPLNPDIGPHRRFDWTRMDLAAIKEVKERLGGTVNDVVLATVAGAVRTFLERRGVEVDDLDFRAQVPVNVRRAEERGHLGNRVVLLLAQLPVNERDPRRRYERVVEVTRGLKSSHQVEGEELLEALSDWTTKELLALLARITARTLAYNIVVTNIPGPQFPVYMLGARMLEVYPVVPLFVNQAVGIALFSYDGALYWGFNACWDALPDLHDLVTAVGAEFETLRKL
jgi:diacylglycerol O-acyltransferase